MERIYPPQEEPEEIVPLEDVGRQMAERLGDYKIKEAMVEKAA